MICDPGDEEVDMWRTLVVLIVGGCLMMPSFAKAGRGATPPLTMDVVTMKAKGGWTAVVIALKNNGAGDAAIQCCTAYLETDAGFAVQSLTRQDLSELNYNRAKTTSTLGGIVAAGLGLGGAIGNVDELIYAGIALGGASAIAGVAGGAQRDAEARNVVIDDIQRVHKFPAGLKVAGVVYFPPKRKWPGSHRAAAVHVTYRVGAREYRVSAPVVAK